MNDYFVKDFLGYKVYIVEEKINYIFLILRYFVFLRILLKIGYGGLYYDFSYVKVKVEGIRV